MVAEVAVAAVVFGPDRVPSRDPVPSGPAASGPVASGPVALVLGAGGVLGAAWMTGALACLAGRLPGPVGDVDLVIGTSAGSVLAAALRCGVPFEEIAAWQRGQATGPLTESAALAAQDGPLPPLPRMRFGSVPLARAALLTPHRVPPWVGASAWLPHGRGQHTTLRSLIGGLQRQAGPDGWPERPTWISAVDYDTGQRVLFGRDGAPAASLTDAVIASCSIPGWYEPAVVGGRRYVDGGVRSMTSLDVLAGTGIQDVYVLAPMASTQPDHPLQPHLRMERRLRQVLTHAVVRQARTLAARGKRVTVLTPGPRDLAAMGINLMDPRRRQAVLELSFRTSAEALAALDDAAPRAALVLERGVEGDVDPGERLADRAASLGVLRHLGELGIVQALDLTANGELDAGQPEPARRIGSERHVGLHVERLRCAARLADQRGQLHRVARGVGRGDELLGTGVAAGVFGGPPRERHLVGGELGARQLDEALALLQGPGPGSACGTGGHRLSSSSSARSLACLRGPSYPRPYWERDPG
jgi:NTE family protein